MYAGARFGIGSLALLAASALAQTATPGIPNPPPDLPHPVPAFPGQTGAPGPVVPTDVRVETISWGLVRPWSLAFLPGGDFLVSERDGRMRIVTPKGAISAPLAGLPDLSNAMLLDIALDPDFARDRLVYFTFGEKRPDGNGMSVAQGRLADDATRLEDCRIIFREGPSRTSKRASGRLAFAPDGMLFVTVTTAGAQKGAPKTIGDAQSMAADGGKVLRIARDGSIPKDNPFVATAGARPEIYTLGHRDIQGAAINPATGALWTIEHGPTGGDELNAIRPGHNYGWKVITYGREEDGSPVGAGITAAAGMDQPLYYWFPSIAPSGMIFYTGGLFPAWKGNIIVGSLKGKHLSRLVVEGEKVVAEEELLADLNNRIRDVRQAPDGSIYILTDEDAGRIIRLTPGDGAK